MVGSNCNQEQKSASLKNSNGPWALFVAEPNCTLKVNLWVLSSLLLFLAFFADEKWYKLEAVQGSMDDFFPCLGIIWMLAGICKGYMNKN